MTVVRDSAWAAAAAITITATRFVLAAVLARGLSKAGFGQYAYAQWLVDLAFLVCSLGVTGVASRYISEYRTRPAKLAAIIARGRPFAIGLPLISGVAVLLAAMCSGLDPGAPALAMLAVWAVANGLWAVHTSVLAGLQRFDQIFLANLVAAAFLLGGLALLPIDGDGVLPVFGLMACAFAAAALVGIGASRHLMSVPTGRIDREDWVGIRRYGLNMWITALLWSLVWSRGEMPVIRAYLGDNGVAQYAAAMTLFGGAIQGVTLAAAGVAPQLTLLWGSGQFDAAFRTARIVMEVQLLFCGAGALLLICLGPELIVLAFGKSYHGVAGPLRELALGLIAMSLSSQNYLLQVASNGRFSRNLMLLGLALLFGLICILTPRFGLSGASVARAATMVLLAGLSFAAVVGRWGMEAASGRNALIVGLVITASAIVVGWRGDESLLSRTMVLGVALLTLGLSLRNREGQLLGLHFPRLLLARRPAANTLPRRADKPGAVGHAP